MNASKQTCRYSRVVLCFSKHQLKALYESAFLTCPIMIKLTKCLVSNPFSSHHKIADDYEVCCNALLLLFNGALNTRATGLDWLSKCTLNT